MASTAAHNETIAQLQEELDFHGVLLSSIDETVLNRHETEQEIKEEIKALKKKLRALQGTGASSASQSQSQSSQPGPSNASVPGSWPTDDIVESSTSRNNASGAASSKMNRLPAASNSYQQTGMSCSASTPKSLESFPNLLSPSSMKLPTRKRSYSKHLDGGLAPNNDGPSKSRRASPSPFMNSYGTSPATPEGESSGDDDFAEFDMQRLKQTQQAAEERLLTQRLDADLARRLESQENTSQSFRPQTSNAHSSASQSGPNAFDRMSGIRPPQSTSQATLPAINSPTSFSNQRPPTAFKSEPRFKHEPSSFPASSSNHTGPEYGAYGRNMNSSISLLDDSDSDIEIIPPTSFRSNGRYQQSYEARIPGYQTPLGHSRSPIKNEQSALSHALYGGQSNTHAWMDLSQPLVSSGPPAMSHSEHLTNPFGHSYDGSSAGVKPTMNRPSMTPFTDINAIANLPPYSSLSGSYMENMAEQYDYIMNDPRKTNDEIKSLLENIQPDVELPKENREGTPDGLKYPLYEHQKVALTWLKQMEDGTNKGGILADDMGLGKTISALALILSRASSDIRKKTTMIVGPVALVRQWEREIQTKVKVSHKLSTLMVHGSNRKHDWSAIRNYDIVLTTYGTIGAEFRRLAKWEGEQVKRYGRDYDTAPMQKMFPLLGPKSVFHRVILDEAQCIKNKNTQAARACCQLSGTYRLCLTGTPMMNSVSELYSLIHFLRIRPYNEFSRFQTEFKCLTKGDSTDREAKRAMQKLQAVLKAILLRRTKQSKIDGDPIINLPPKTEEIQHVVFNEDEQAFYSALETKTQIQFNKYMKANTVGRNYSNILVLLLRLRQCCCHPHLITDYEEAPAGADISTEIMVELAKGLNPDVVRRLLAVEDSGFECPVCYDGVPNPSIIIPCGHDTCAECLTKINDQAAQAGVMNGDEGGGGCKCPTCRGKVDMNKIIDYNTFKKVHLPGEVADGDDATAASDSDSGSDSNSDSDAGSDTASETEEDVNSDGDLRNFIVPDDVDDDVDVETEDKKDKSDFDDLPDLQNLASQSSKKKTKSDDKHTKKDKKGKKKGKKQKKEKKGPKGVGIAYLKKMSKTKAGRKKYMRFLRKRWEPSAKTTKCVELLDQFQGEGRKTIVFSQFVSLLDLLQVPLEENGWGFERYDGGMSADERNDAINAFTDKPDCRIMLISLKAGNAGLNLVAASRVIILDPFWNPFIEMQAVDRAYRIGQQNAVEVHRILIQSTVEDRIIELQEKKRTLVNAALDETANKSLGRLGARELAYLFGVGGR